MKDEEFLLRLSISIYAIDKLEALKAHKENKKLGNKPIQFKNNLLIPHNLSLILLNSIFCFSVHRQ